MKNEIVALISFIKAMACVLSILLFINALPTLALAEPRSPRVSPLAETASGGESVSFAGEAQKSA